MGIAYIRNMEVSGSPFVLCEVIGMSIVGGVPPRPHPQPPDPPIDPPHPWDPIFPWNPIQLPPWVGKPQPPLPDGSPVQGAIVAWVPAGHPEVPPTPADPASLKPMFVYLEKGAPPLVAYAGPYVAPHA